MSRSRAAPSTAEGVEIEFASSPRPQDAALRLHGRHGRRLLGRTDAGDGDLPEGPRLRHRLLRRGRDARSLPADGPPAAAAGFHARRPQVGEARHGERGADAVALPAARPAAGRHRSRLDPSRRRPDHGAQRRGAEGRRGRRHPGVRALPQPAARRQGARTSGTRRRAAARPPTRRSTRGAARSRSGATSCCAWCGRSPGPETWVASASGAEIADAIAPYFSDLPRPILEAACTRYKALEIWNTTPILPRAGYDRLRDGLVSGGFVSPGTTVRDRGRQQPGRGRHRRDSSSAVLSLARAERLGALGAVHPNGSREPLGDVASRRKSGSREPRSQR